MQEEKFLFNSETQAGNGTQLKERPMDQQNFFAFSCEMNTGHKSQIPHWRNVENCMHAYTQPGLQKISSELSL